MHFEYRLKLYEVRKKYLLKRLERDLEELKNKVRFIKEVNDN